MRKFNLQLFAEAVHGKRMIYMFRVHDDAATSEGTVLSFVTENTRSKSMESESTVTKDGSITAPGAIEGEVSSTSILAKGDTMADKLEDALDNAKLLDIWEVNLDEPADTDGKFKGRYFQGYLTELEITASAEEYVELSHTFALNGAGVKGDVTVSAEQQAMADYVFTDTTKTGA